ncbi:MAG: outer membrane protein assembly factor BamD [Chitinispirillaceae bacterium]|jgi:outer membrane protein assembly factor BamD|nr:outer membrane protein assembly factor BamD [Chitinispirillaceae bacterium]
MKKNAAIVLCAALLCVTFPGCSAADKMRKQRAECPARFALAVKKYQAGKYGTAKVILDEVKLQCAGLDMMDTAGYYLAQSLLHMKLYGEAKIEFTRLMQDFPRSVFVDEAQFRIAWCVFKDSRPPDRDQAETREALALFRDFLESHPEGEWADSAQHYMIMTIDKLAAKEFASAKFYQKMGEKDAAIVYYKSFIGEYPASRYTAQARLSMGELLAQLGRNGEAKEVLDELVAQEKEGEIVQKAQAILARIGTGD